MTKINKMVLHGFKSFAKRTELLFGKDFNCVLGPNGSGKSNVLDSLCFVLGKSSAKSMRAEKSSNLIYNGGKSKKPAKQAEVSIYLDNTSQIFPSEDKEVKVTRIVKQNGQGVYKINDETRTRAQILELLSLAKVNPDGYNIILQGDIIKLIDMTPIERRQIIEEISGISIYEDKKQKAMNELEKVGGRIKEAEIILAERETYLKELKKERDQASKFKKLDSMIKTNKATSIHRQTKQKEAEKEELDYRTDKHKQKLEKVSAEITNLREQITERKNKINNINSEIEEKGEKEQIALHREVEKLKVDLATSKNRMESCRDEIAKIITRKSNLKENITDVDSKIKELETTRKEKQRETEIRTKEMLEIKARLEKFRTKHKLDNVGQIEKEMDELDTRAEEVQKEIQELRLKQQDFLREKDKLEFQIESIDERIAKVLEVEKENKDQIQSLKQKRTEFKKATLELNQLQTRNTAMAAEIGESRNRLLDSQEQLSKLNARKSQIQEKLGGNIALKRILENKKKFGGVYGTVSELGEVSSKYGLAMEIAAGGKIKSIVVENDKVAADCINYLKSNKLGVATFLPLNKIKGKPEAPGLKNILASNGVLGRAVDLISHDPKFKKIFQYVFGNIVIIRDISTARRIGIGTAKMVTLDGDITARSGSMQGGFRQKREGLGFSEKEVNTSLQQYEKISADMGQKISKLESQKKDDEDQIARIRELKANLEGDIIKIEKSLHLDEGDLDANRKVKQELNKKIKNYEKEINEVQNNIAQQNSKLAQNKIKRQQLREKINQLRNPTLIAELNAFEEKKTETRETLIKLESETKALKTQMETMLAPEKENILKIMKQHDKETEDFESEIKTLAAMVKIKDVELRQKEKKEKIFYSQFKELFNQRTKLSDEVSKKEAKVFTLTDDVRKTEHKVNTINLEVAKILAEIGGLAKEFEQFQDVEIDHDKSDSQLAREITQFARMVEDMGAVNLRALEIYDTVEKEYRELNAKKDMLSNEKEDVLKLMEEIEGKKTALFMKTYDVIQVNFQKLFGMLSTKGEASLVLENSEMPFEGGLLIRVRITGNKFMDIRSLSGGEKTMTALAFLFSVQEHEPAPFYILDEVDAALDKKNSEKLAELIKEYSSHAQYILISHNDGVIAEANTLYGISMNTHGMSDVVSLKL